MALYKFKADRIFDGSRFLDPTAVLVCAPDGTILAIADEKTIDPTEIQYYDGIITPGFINTHCHLELSYLVDKISKHIGLPNFLLQVIMKRHILLNPDTINKNIRQALTQTYKRGTVAIADICNTDYALPVKLENPQMYFHNFIECIGFDIPIKEEKWNSFERVFTRYRTAQPVMECSYAPHAPYSVSYNLLSRLGNLTKEKITTIHNQESEAENHLYRNKTGDFIDFYKRTRIPYEDFKPTGKRSMPSVFPYFRNSKKIISVHNNATTLSDIQWLRKHKLAKKVYFALCPQANLYIQNMLPPVGLLRAEKMNITLGTDSLASAETLCLLKEMRILQENFSVPTEELLMWATANGAVALDISDKMGKFAVNTKPGIVHISHIQNGKFTNKSESYKIL